MGEGKIIIGDQYLLDWLKLEGGIIREIRYSYEAKTIEIIIEHPEIPECKEGESITIIALEYKKTVDKGVERITRQPLRSL